MPKISISITELDGNIFIASPYNPDFVSRIKVAGAKWDASGKTWVMDTRAIETAREILRDVYGEDDRGGERVTVRVTVGEDALEKLQCPVVILGRTVASAQGRDSGARIGEGVSFIRDAPSSGGSVKNWRTIVPAGSVFDLYDVPLAAAQAALDAQKEEPLRHKYSSYGDGVIYSIEAIAPAAPATLDRDALTAERERLAARIAEIDKLLG